MKKIILIMDQDSGFMALYDHLISKDRFLVIKSANYEDSMAWILSLKIHLIICDIEKPEGPGIKLLNKLNSSEIKIPLVAVSGDFHPTHRMIIERDIPFISKHEIKEKLDLLLMNDSKIWSKS